MYCVGEHCFPLDSHSQAQAQAQLSATPVHFFQLEPPSHAPAPPHTPHPKSRKKYLIPGILAAFLLGLIVFAFFYSSSATPQEVPSRVLPPPTAESLTLETAATPEAVDKADDLIAPIPEQERSARAIPSPTADIGTILTYLLARQVNLDNHQWSEEAKRALANKSHWKSKSGYPPTFEYAAGFDTPHPYRLFFSPTIGDWGLTSSMTGKIE